MSKKDKVGYTLSDQKGIALPEEQIRLILRAADEIIYKAGRTMLAKILKGFKRQDDPPKFTGPVSCLRKLQKFHHGRDHRPDRLDDMA